MDPLVVLHNKVRFASCIIVRPVLNGGISPQVVAICSVFELCFIIPVAVFSFDIILLFGIFRIPSQLLVT